MTENDDAFGYGFEDDKPEQGGGLQFGLNSGVTTLTKFEFNPNGGAEGAPQEALDVVLNVNGRDVSYRMFPVTKAFDENNEEVTDPRHPAMKKAMREFNAVVVHILHAFVEKEAIRTALNNPIASFQQFCTVAKNILPQDFATKPLDIFAQWQWQITGDNDKTYLRLPKNVKHGKWICAHIPPVGQWKEQRLNGGLVYVDDENNKHPFKRQKWFMDNKFAAQQVDPSLEAVHTTEESASGEASAGGTKWA